VKYAHKFDPYANASFVILVTIVIFELLDAFLHQLNNVTFLATFWEVLLCPMYVAAHKDKQLNFKYQCITVETGALVALLSRVD